MGKMKIEYTPVKDGIDGVNGAPEDEKEYDAVRRKYALTLESLFERFETVYYCDNIFFKNGKDADEWSVYRTGSTKPVYAYKK